MMPTITEKRIFNVVGSIYDLAKEPSIERWQTIYDDLAVLVSSGPGGLGVLLRESDRFNFVAGTVPLAGLDRYNKDYGSASQFHHAIKNTRVGSSFNRVNYFPDDHFERSEIYDDLFRPHDVFHIEYWPLFETSNLIGSIGFSRSRSQANFSVDERRAMSVIVPHLTKALIVYLTFAEARQESLNIATALNSLKHSVLVIDEARKIKFANESASDILRRKDGLEVQNNGTLRAQCPGDDRLLGDILGQVFAKDLDLTSEHNAALRVSRPNGRRPLQALVTRFSDPERSIVGTGALALMLIHDPETQTETDEDVLIKMYGLTAAEAHFTALLARGDSMQDACDHLEITQNTARTHLKHIFAKTETKRQSELVKLVLNWPVVRRIAHI